MQVPLPVYVTEGFCMSDFFFWGAESLHVVNADHVIMAISQVTGYRLRGRGTSADFVSPLPQRNNLPRNMLPLI